ncbi:hypothetical protein [Archangium sp.]|uniref:hypothetical protein n=1 Tax=Archangium sp. TaxID=1872627 RepID=UPI002D42457B|nr:hypothetical protein [Archangium sp.]HYO55618.1 hypothetical protein [Archangium sp.]
MSPNTRGLAALLCAAALLGGCKKEESAPVEDRTLDKLRQEVDRVNQGGAPAAPPDANADPNARLAGLAAGHEADPVKTYALPSKENVKAGTLALQPTGLESLHSVRGSGKVALTTHELFLRVKLEAQNVGQTPVHVALSTARLVDMGGKEYPIASDAQTVGGTRKLDRTWEQEQRESMALLFEVPPAAIAPGLSLLVPTPSGEDARIPLQ